jgi:polyisoprenoid-binding protein YceI
MRPPAIPLGPMGRLVASAAASLATASLALACGGSVQRARLSSSPVDVRAPAPVGERDGKRFAAHAGSSALVVVGSATFSGDHEFTFRRWNATLVGDPPTQLRMEAEATTVAAEEPWMEDMIRTDLLEVERFPRATLVADLLPIAGEPDARLVVGNATVHGITRGIRFRATLARDGEAWKLAATFDMSRKAFDVRLHNRWDAFIHDDFRLVLDFRATPERVFVEDPEDDGLARRR